MADIHDNEYRYDPKMPMADYLALEAVSAGLIKRIHGHCPRAAWADSWLNPDKVSNDNKATDTGTIAHSLLLEDTPGSVVVVDPEDYPAQGTGKIPDGWTNKGIQTRRNEIRAEGNIPILKNDYAEVERIVDSGRNFIESLRLTEPAIWAAMQPGGGDSEAVMQWKEDGVKCRMRPDRFANERDLMIDLKTTATSANPVDWGRTQLTGLGGYISAAHYIRGCEKAFLTSPRYVFLVIEVKPPYLCSLIGCSPEALQIGTEKVESGIKLWKACVDRNYWPGYPNRVAYPEAPVWLGYQWEEQQQGYEYNIEDLHGKPKEI